MRPALLGSERLADSKGVIKVYALGKVYVIHEETVTWAVANETCKQLGGELAQPNTEYEQDFLTDKVQYLKSTT